MSDPKDYHTIDLKVLEAQSLNQLKDLQRCLGDHIERKQGSFMAESTLGREIAKELTDSGYGSVKVKLEFEIVALPRYRPYTARHQRSDKHPEVQDYMKRLKKVVNEAITEERLQKHGLTEADREGVEDHILNQLR